MLKRTFLRIRRRRRLSFIPYLKYVLAPDTRFERDHEIFFGPNGKVAKGEPLINYGWGYGGLKEFVKAYYETQRKTGENFDTYYAMVKTQQGNLLGKMAADNLLQPPLRGLITARIHENLFIPILVVDFTLIRFKYCENCLRRWEGRRLPARIDQCLGANGLSQRIRGMRCTRMACNHLCGNYENCVLNYTSTEEDPMTEEKILDCLSALISLLRESIEPPRAFECREIEQTDQRPKPVGPLKPESKCFERPVRFDFKPIRRRHVDPKTWKNIQEQRMDHGAHHIIDLIPANLMPDILEDQVRRTDVSAPLEARGVLENFIKMANIRFEIRIDFSHQCNLCGKRHTLSRVPISAMFKTDQAYIQEAGFGNMLWELLWQEFPKEMCSNYPEECKVADSPILKRELKVSILTGSANDRDYDYAVDLKPLTGNKGWLLFNLTTGLWKKGGFHEARFEPDNYIQYERDMLIQIPSSLQNTKSIWYVVVPSTEEQFFDNTAPEGATNMNMLLKTITNGDSQKTLTPVVIFNSTSRTGEARAELRKLRSEAQLQQTRIYPIVQELLKEVE